MSFNSLQFILFFAFILVGYRLLPLRGQNFLLLCASLFFYATFSFKFLGLLLVSILIDYICGHYIYVSQRKKAWLYLSLFLNLALLGIFKYYNFFTENFIEFFGLQAEFTKIVMPIGISFYTFQSMSYSLDIYRGELKPIKSFLDFSLFVSFFPQLVSGPIERASSLLPQITQERHITKEQLQSGCWLLLFGFFKKVVIADQLIALYEPIFKDPQASSAGAMLLAFYACALVVYCDFSGYSDIARGCAKLLGFELVFNFKIPFFSVNIQEFWNRWHISLSQWIRTYMFYPLMLGGITRGMTRLNLFITMVVIGVWHGAGIQFLIFGVFHGLLLVLFESSRSIRKKLRPSSKTSFPSHFYRIFSILFTFHLVVIALAIFECHYYSKIKYMFGALSQSSGSFTLETSSLIAFFYFSIPLFIIHLYQEKNKDLEMTQAALPLKTGLMIFMSLSILFHGVLSSSRFIYYAF